jgi:AraC-like DNA-binding protein
VDVLTDLLARARARGAVFSCLELAQPWGVMFGGRRPLTLHGLLAGAAWLEADGAAPRRLAPGDLVLGRPGVPYRIVSAPGGPAIPIDEARRRGSDPPSAGARARLLCGAYTLEGTVCDGLLGSLPRFVPVPAAGQDAALAAVVRLLGAEIDRDAPGQQTVLDRLLDLLLVYVIRAWFAQPGATPPGWYRALDDPALGPVLRAVHADPARHWTVEAMARVAGVSRAAFARHFAAAVGSPPAAYLTSLRMDLADAALLRPGATLAAVAAQVGYSTEFAFSDAFKRHHGMTPGRWRHGQVPAVAEPLATVTASPRR